MPSFVTDVEELRKRAAQKIEEGPITETYQGDSEQTISILNEALATEIVCVLRYMHHYFMATGVHAMAVRDEFKEHADAEREHADKIADRIQQLGRSFQISRSRHGRDLIILETIVSSMMMRKRPPTFSDTNPDCLVWLTSQWRHVTTDGEKPTRATNWPQRVGLERAARTIASN